MSYQPAPIDTTNIRLPPEILDLGEQLAHNAHDVWARQRIADGWRHGPQRDDLRKLHPSLVPYDQLPESEKHYDRLLSTETLKTIIALGFQITRQRGGGGR